MNKRLLATISGLLSFTIGIALAFVLGGRQEEASLCYRKLGPLPRATHPEVSTSQTFQFQEQLDEQPVFGSRHFDGTIFWSGTVTGRTNIVLHKSSLDFQTLTGTATLLSQRRSTMPAKPMRIRLSNVTGKVRIFQAPGPSNGYVTVVQVEGNHDLVSFALYWTMLR